MEKIFNKIPLWAINGLSFLSAIITIIASIYSFISLVNGENNVYIYAIIGLALLLLLFLLILRTRKYQKIAFEQQLVTSFVYHKLTHISRDLYFDTMRNHKDKTDNVRSLTDSYKTQLSNLLSLLCDLMEKYCGQKTSSCIKLITKPNAKLEDITLTTFCRSTTSNTIRGVYEKNKPIKLTDNTDFLYIVDPNGEANLNYFYKGDLKAYSNELIQQGKKYKNTNSNWENDYVGTIVVPIQIEHKRLYDTPEEDSLYLIGFLCIDSDSTSAFLDRQERINVDILKSFADIMFILLSQYQHYLEKIKSVC